MLIIKLRSHKKKIAKKPSRFADEDLDKSFYPVFKRHDKRNNVN